MSEHEVQRYVLIQQGEVITTVLWDGHSEWNPGEDVEIVLEEEYLKTLS